MALTANRKRSPLNFRAVIRHIGGSRAVTAAIAGLAGGAIVMGANALVFAVPPPAPINACVLTYPGSTYAPVSGNVRLLAPGQNCKSVETPVSWDLQGPQGIPGPQGVQGIQGPLGPQGIQGLTGTNGTNGTTVSFYQKSSSGSAGAQISQLSLVCDGADPVVGGGLRGTPNTDNMVISASGPVGSDAWFVMLSSKNGTPTLPAHTAYIICADLTP